MSLSMVEQYEALFGQPPSKEVSRSFDVILMRALLTHEDFFRKAFHHFHDDIWESDEMFVVWDTFKTYFAQFGKPPKYGELYFDSMNRGLSDDLTNSVKNILERVKTVDIDRKSVV